MNKCAKHFYLMSVVVTVYLARRTRRGKSLAFQMTHSKPGKQQSYQYSSKMLKTLIIVIAWLALIIGKQKLEGLFDKCSRCQSISGSKLFR